LGNVQILEASAVTYNSILAVYCLLLSSGRLASYRPEPLVEEMRGVPLARCGADSLAKIGSFQEIDDLVRTSLGLSDAEWAIVDDLFHFTLPDFKGDENSPGRQPTERKPKLKTASGREPHLAAYCRDFIDVLQGGFGEDKHVCATIFQDGPQSCLPVRLVAIHLDWDRKKPIVVEPIDSAELSNRLMELDQKFLQVGDTSRGGIFFQRVARVYVEEQHGRRTVPTIYIVKPDRIRYWTRSAGMRDADEVAADIWSWKSTQPLTSEARKPQ
jgi:hypothetical protein